MRGPCGPVPLQILDPFILILRHPVKARQAGAIATLAPLRGADRNKTLASDSVFRNYRSFTGGWIETECQLPLLTPAASRRGTGE